MENEYDGPPPSFYRRIEYNNLLDCRDPDHDSRLCPICGDYDPEQEADDE